MSFKNYLFLFTLFVTLNAFSQENIEQSQDFDDVVEACISTNSQDEVCKTIIQAREIGDDYIEALKQYVKMGPYEYAILTTANMFATNRLRIKFKALFFKDAVQTLDVQKDQVSTSIEFRF